MVPIICTSSQIFGPADCYLVMSFHWRYQVPDTVVYVLKEISVFNITIHGPLLLSIRIFVHPYKMALSHMKKRGRRSVLFGTGTMILLFIMRWNQRQVLESDYSSSSTTIVDQGKPAFISKPDITSDASSNSTSSSTQGAARNNDKKI